MASDLDETDRFQPRFDSSGLITAIVSDARDNAVLMVAHMNAQALRLTQETGIAHFWSRNRNSLWKKGETSGELQQVVEMRMDCDQDAVLMRVVVQGHGTACHTGRTSCFYRSVERQEDGSVKLVFTGSPRVNPAELYRNK
jgi:phosphoribosyl-AMP cyclohydrolase